MSERLHESLLLQRVREGRTPEDIKIEDLEKALRTLFARFWFEKWMEAEQLQPMLEEISARKAEVLLASPKSGKKKPKFSGPYFAVAQPDMVTVYVESKEKETNKKYAIFTEDWKPVAIIESATKVKEDTKTLVDLGTNRDTFYQVTIKDWKTAKTEYAKRWPQPTQPSWSWRAVAEAVGLVAIIALLASRRRPALQSPRLGVDTTQV